MHIDNLLLPMLFGKLTSMIPGAGTGTSASFFIVALENPSSSTLTSLTLYDLKIACYDYIYTVIHDTSFI